MDFDCRSVPIDRIRTTDQTFKISTATDVSDLALSISAIGLLHPPILIEKKEGYAIVSGFRRIAACNQLNVQTVYAHVLPPDCSEASCAVIAVAENALQRELNVIEQARAYALVNRFVGEPSSWATMASQAGLPPSQAAMNRLLPVAKMPGVLQEAILSGCIALSVALAVNQLDQDDRAGVVSLFQALNTGLNIQRELLEMIREIALRDGISITALIQQADIAAVLNHDELPQSNKVQKLRRILKTRRYPALSAAEDEFQQSLRSIKLDPQIQLHHPPFFEGKAYRLTMTIQSKQQFKKRLSQLEKLASHPRILPD